MEAARACVLAGAVARGRPDWALGRREYKIVKPARIHQIKYKAYGFTPVAGVPCGVRRVRSVNMGHDTGTWKSEEERGVKRSNFIIRPYRLIFIGTGCDL